MKNLKFLKLTLLTMILFLPTLTSASIPNRISELFTPVKIKRNQITLKTPEIAESGAVVSIKITNIRGLAKGVYVTEILLFNDFRQQAVAHFKIAKNVSADGLTTRVKMKKTGNIYVMAKLSNGEVLGTEKQIKVTKGGCGGG